MQPGLGASGRPVRVRVLPDNDKARRVAAQAGWQATPSPAMRPGWTYSLRTARCARIVRSDTSVALVRAVPSYLVAALTRALAGCGGRHQYLSCAERMADSHAIRPGRPVPRPRPLLSTTPLTHQADAAPAPAPFHLPITALSVWPIPSLSWGNLVMPS